MNSSSSSNFNSNREGIMKKAKRLLGNASNAINNKLRTHMDLPTIQLLMMIFVFILVGILALCIFNPLQITNNMINYVIVSEMILLSLFLLLLYLSMNPKMTNGAFNMGQMKKYLARFLGLFMSGFGFALLAVIPVLILSTAIGTNAMSGVLILLGALILITTTALIIYAFFYAYLAKQTDKSYPGLLKNTILYIPCLVIELIEWMKEQYKLTNKTYWFLLAFDILFIILYFNLAKIEKMLKITSETVLLKEPIYLTKKKTIGSYEDLKNANQKKLNKEDDKYVLEVEPATSSANNENNNEND